MIKRMSYQSVFTACAMAFVGVSLSACGGFKAKHYTPQEVKAYLQKVADERAANPNPENAPVAPAPAEPTGEPDKTSGDTSPADTAKAILLEEMAKGTEVANGPLKEFLAASQAAFNESNSDTQKLADELVQGVDVDKKVLRTQKGLNLQFKALVDLNLDGKRRKDDLFVVEVLPTDVTYRADGALTPIAFSLENLKGEGSQLPKGVNLTLTAACVNNLCESGLLEMKYGVAGSADTVSVYFLFNPGQTPESYKLGSSLKEVVPYEQALASIESETDASADLTVTTADAASAKATPKLTGSQRDLETLGNPQSGQTQGATNTNSGKIKDAVIAGAGAAANTAMTAGSNAANSIVNFVTGANKAKPSAPAFKTASQREDDRVGQGSKPAVAPAKPAGRKCKRIVRICVEWE